MDKNELLEIVEKLELLSVDYNNLAKDIMKQDTQVMKIDLVALSVLNRAISINNAFRTLIKEDNTFSALHLIRIQIDNLIRYYSILIAEDENYLDYVLDGKPINRFKDLNGKLFSDKYLAEKFDERFKGMLDLYLKYCSHIHFGKEHLERIKSINESEEAKFRVEVGSFDNYSFDELKIFVIDMITVSINLYKIIQDWVLTKKNHLYD
ncbi:hypothetical protein JAO76_10895 [Pontibacter sp. BT310]|uniref:Uncharacterized protein n=1 Tax=Pontibacter populi TaxID=890055 RepID=A0ABS6XC09_9BACT|nr:MULTISPECIES: hypothetical protein [Pontibacter]MBJ6118703.1 hypothetical protein [Pontibacter sp. BT310]MBR0571132.1 hypothetical protein [Microvirga sp. STS03]MBW3365557.1 hypothetical protein [Pontibacter populi]